LIFPGASFSAVEIVEFLSIAEAHCEPSIIAQKPPPFHPAVQE